MIPPIVGIAGKARTGKNTLANFIEARYDGYQYAFAQPLRNMLRAGFGIDFDTEYWASRKEYVIPALGRSPRELMQTLGTEWGRELVHPDVWLIMATQILVKRGPGMIISDLRFENEAQWVRDRGGVVIHISRKAADAVNPHASESGILFQPHSRDIAVFNDMDLASLQHTVSKLWE